MPTFRTSRPVQHDAVEMFDLVADVESYPAFLPLCQGLKIRKRTDLGEGRVQLLADMQIGYKAVRETFVSRVTLDRPKLQIEVEYVDGPFRRMENRWTFRDVEPAAATPASLVDFFIDYEFKSRMFGLLMGSVFDAAFRRFAEAFEQRADRTYPRDPRATPT